MSIKTKALLILALFSLLPVSIIALVGLPRNQEILEKQIGASSLEYARLSMSRITEQVYCQFKTVRNLGATVGGWIFEDTHKTSEISDHLQDIFGHSSDFQYVLLVNSKGTILSSDVISLVGKSVPSFSDYKNALNGKADVRDVTDDPLTHEKTVIFSAPVISNSMPAETGKLLIIAAVKWGEMITMVAEQVIGGATANEENHLMLTRSDGEVLACFEEEEIFRENLIQIGMKSAKYASEEKEGNVTEITEHDITSFSTYTYMKPYKDMPSLKWNLVMLQDPNRVLASIASLKSMTHYLLLGIAIIGIVASFFFAGKISKPILEISEATKKIGGGDLVVEVPVRSKDELGLLANSFNIMATNLAESTVSKEYVDKIIDSMMDALFVADSAGKIRRLNGAVCTLLDFSEGELLGKNLTIILPENLHSESILDSDKNYLKRKNGTEVPVFLSRSEMRDKNDRLLNTVWVAKDINEHVKSEEKLENLNRDLQQASIQAGMAEIATGVLHNIGNGLNSVNVSTALILQKSGENVLTDLRKGLELLAKNEDNLYDFLSNDSRGKKLIEYFSEVLDKLSREQEEIKKEAKSLFEHVKHIEGIVRTQQAYAKTSGIDESIYLNKLVKDAIDLNTAAFKRHNISVVLKLEKCPHIDIQKHKVLQILNNLLQNANHALCENTSIDDKQISINLTNGTENITIAVKDNGMGIEEENLTKIFSHGFTTRKSGHGFGLHISALSAEDLGGTLTAKSRGPGKGASFILQLPYIKKGKGA